MKDEICRKANRKRKAYRASSRYAVNRLDPYTAIGNRQSAICNPTYDLNGNMTWDGANAYDAMGRRVRKAVYGYDSGTTAYSQQSTAYFYYDGWNLVRETVQLNSLTPPNSLTNYYTWDNDLSGSIQGAGGALQSGGEQSNNILGDESVCPA